MEKAGGRAQVTRLGKILIGQYQLANGIHTDRVCTLRYDRVRLSVIHQGVVTLQAAPRASDRVLNAGTFYLHHVTEDNHFKSSSGVVTQSIVLPAAQAGALIRGKKFFGLTTSPEMRILMAHAGMIQRTSTALSPSASKAAHNALVELVKGVALSRFDTGEPIFVPALAQAARNLADALLDSPELSSSRIAADLHVSLRTLQRAFSTTGESLTGYIRRRRLEASAQALLSGQLSVSQAAARWQFSDSSHFIRSFRGQYHHSPARFARQFRKGAGS